MRWSMVVVLWLASMPASLRRVHCRRICREGERVSDACNGFNFKTLAGCAYELFKTTRYTLRRVACRRRTDSVSEGRSSGRRTRRIGG